MKKDRLYSVKSIYGAETFYKQAPWIADDIQKYINDGFAVYVKCGKCNNKHDIRCDCQVCGKKVSL